MRIRIPFVLFAASSFAAADQAHLEASPFEGNRQPRLHASTLSLYGTAADYERTLDLRLALEWPLSDRNSAVAGLRRRTFRQASPEHGDGFDREGWGFEAALRRHPWEWMPGFFVQGIMAWERSIARNLRPSDQPNRIPHTVHVYYDGTVRRIDRTAFEGGFGFGYAWTLGRVSLEWQGLFGPAIWQDEARYYWKDPEGVGQSFLDRYGNWSEFLRFRDLRIGYRF
jgi:hypothetical protein